MNTGSALLRRARNGAGLTQRDLARRSGVAQPAIARIESGRVVPRVDTLERLLDACEQTLETTVRSGVGIDRTVIRQLLSLTPRQRLELAATEARNLDRFLGAARRT